MPQSELRLVKRSVEFIENNRIGRFPGKLRGLYVLYFNPPGTDKFDVVYVGMAGTGTTIGMRGRLKDHFREKGNLWTHFSMYEVWDNISKEEVKELEGLFRHIYRRDSNANRLNAQGGYDKLRHINKKNPIQCKPSSV